MLVLLTNVTNEIGTWQVNVLHLILKADTSGKQTKGNNYKEMVYPLHPIFSPLLAFYQHGKWLNIHRFSECEIQSFPQ